MALITSAEFKTWAGISGSSEDSWISAAIGYVGQMIKTWVGYNIESATYTEFKSGDYTRFLRMNERPITSITTLHLDASGRFGVPSDAFGSDNLLTAGDDYVLVYDGVLPGTSTACSKAGLIERVNNVWPGVRRRTSGEISAHSMYATGNVKVVYVAGYSTIPDDIKLAALQLMSWYRRIRKTGANLQSESLGSYSYSLASGKEMEFGSARALLSRYRNVSIGLGI